MPDQIIRMKAGVEPPSSQVSVSIPDGMKALGKTHMCITLPLSSLAKVAFETVPMLVKLNRDPPSLRSWDISLFLSPLLFSSGDQCCESLICLCTESSSNFKASLHCQVVEQLSHLQCLLVYLPLHSPLTLAAAD